MDFLDELEEMIDEEHGFEDGQGILEGELELRVRKGCQLPPLQSDVVLKKEPGYAVNVFDTDGNLIGCLGRIGRERLAPMMDLGYLEVVEAKLGKNEDGYCINVECTYDEEIFDQTVEDRPDKMPCLYHIDSIPDRFMCDWDYNLEKEGKDRYILYVEGCENQETKDMLEDAYPGIACDDWFDSTMIVRVTLKEQEKKAYIGLLFYADEEFGFKEIGCSESDLAILRERINWWLKANHCTEIGPDYEFLYSTDV